MSPSRLHIVTKNNNKRIENSLMMVSFLTYQTAYPETLWKSDRSLVNSDYSGTFTIAISFCAMGNVRTVFTRNT